MTWPTTRAAAEARPVRETRRVDVRLAREDEFAVVGDLTVRAYRADGFLDDGDSYADRLRDAAARAAQAELWVAAPPDGGSPLGTVTFCPSGSPYREVAAQEEGEFRMLAVDPSARGLGIGRALAAHCVARSRDLGFTAVVLSSLPVMTAAQGLYSDLGFVRDPDLDWSPVPDVVLLGFRLAL